MHGFPPALQRLVRQLSRLPTIGEKSASRLAYHLIANDKDLAYTLSTAIQSAAEEVTLCTRCFHLAEGDLCAVCSNTSRDASLLCVVEKPMDVAAIERLSEYRGCYHVLHGLWAPLRGEGPESMRLEELMQRVVADEVQEVILALSSTVEGDATALYIARLLAEKGVRSSRLAQGMPKGGELEYADEVTISRALMGRSNIPIAD